MARRNATLARLGLLDADFHVRAEYSRMLNRVEVLRAPRELGLEQGTASLKFFNDLRAAGEGSAARVVIDLRRCEKLYVEACLIMHAEAHRIRARKGTDSFRGILPRSQTAQRRLRTMGLIPALAGEARQLQGMGFDANASPAKFVVVETGVTLDGGESQGVAKAFAQGLDLDDVSYKPIHSALNDALENISEHAYAETDEARWWACAVSPPDEPVSYLLAYDLGVTIPATVPLTAQKVGTVAVAALRRLVQRDDAEAAEHKDLLIAAFDPTVTRRENGAGGRGLPSMRHLADQYPGGELSVWSGRASVWTKEGKLESAPLKGELKGTFVLWCIKTGEKA